MTSCTSFFKFFSSVRFRFLFPSLFPLFYFILFLGWRGCSKNFLSFFISHCWGGMTWRDGPDLFLILADKDWSSHYILLLLLVEATMNWSLVRRVCLIFTLIMEHWRDLLVYVPIVVFATHKGTFEYFLFVSNVAWGKTLMLKSVTRGRKLWVGASRIKLVVKRYHPFSALFSCWRLFASVFRKVMLRMNLSCFCNGKWFSLGVEVVWHQELFH